jgi:hypothetical protein
MGSLIFGAVSITSTRRCSHHRLSRAFKQAWLGVAALTQQADCGMVPGDSALLALGC